jgi:hypothetical protein
MNVKHGEQCAAEELDALLTARLAGQEEPTSSHLSAPEATFASELVKSSNAMQPMPDFVDELAAQLERTARNSQQTQSSFLQNFSARRQTMFKRMTIALTSAVALAVAIFIVLPLLNSQQNLPPLPSLAVLSAYAQGRTSGNGVFPGTTFVLSTTLPASPNRVAVYRQAESNSMTLEAFRRLAEQFGLRGQVYTKGNSAQAATGFAVFDGTRQLSMTGDMVSYNDTGLLKSLDSTPPLPFAQAAEQAKQFLQTHGLLDTSYRIEPSPNVPDRVVRFVRLLNGAPIQNADIEVVVASSGEIAAVSFRPLALEHVGDYPIRSAQAAWEELAAGKISNRMQYSIRRDERSTSVPAPRIWRPTLRPGQRIDLYGSVAVYRPVDNSGVIYRLNEYELRGKTQGLDQAGAPIHIWGTMVPDGRSFDVAGWEKVSAPLFSPFRGTIQRVDGIVLLHRDDGKTFLLPNAPDDLPNGTVVSGGGRETNRTENNYPVLDWTSMMSPPDSLPTFSQFDSSPAFQGNAVVVPVQTIAPGGPAPVVPPPPGQGGPVSGGGYAPPIRPPTPPLVAGQRAEGLEGWLQAYYLESADGKTRTLEATLAEMPLLDQSYWQVKLTGQGLEGIGQYDRLHVRVWGRYVTDGDQPTIQVERYAKAYPDERIQAWLGKEEIATVQGREVAMFQSREGQRYVLALSLRDPRSLDYMRQPTDLPGGGQQLLVEGVIQRETFAGYPVLEEISAHSDANVRAMTDLKGYQLEPRPQIIRPQRPLMPGKAYVEKVEIVYYLVPAFPGSVSRSTDPSLRIVQPLWKFTGHTQDGASFEILVQAVSDQYVK